MNLVDGTFNDMSVNNNNSIIHIVPFLTRL